MKNTLIILFLSVSHMVVSQDQTINGVLTVNNSSSNTLRIEDNAPGQEALLRFRSKPASNTNWMHADIGVISTSSNLDDGFIGFKIPANNIPNQGYKMIVNSIGNVGIGTTSPFTSLNNTGLNVDHGGHSSILIGDGITSGEIIQSSDDRQRIFIGSNVYDDVNLSWKNFTAGNNAGIDIIGDLGLIRFFTSENSNGLTGDNVRLSISKEGNIGVGPSASGARMTISGDNSTASAAINFNHGGNGMSIGLSGDNSSLVFGNSWNPESGTYMTIQDISGNVGIGTTTTGSHKLAVEGSIGAREITVEATDWADFVFEDNYELRTLEEVEEHINEKGHLPEIPNEAEVTQNGINLGEMDAKLLQKIEELTLYMIDLNKRVNELQTENNELKAKVQSFENE